jgi:hypothetical protein
MTLEHDLSKEQIAACPGVSILSENGTELALRDGAKTMVVNPQNGTILLEFKTDDLGVIIGVQDPKKRARLAVELRGPGSGPGNPIQHGTLTLTLKSPG